MSIMCQSVRFAELPFLGPIYLIHSLGSSLAEVEVEI